jgi:hypothetical protein
MSLMSADVDDVGWALLLMSACYLLSSSLMSALIAMLIANPAANVGCRYHR